MNKTLRQLFTAVIVLFVILGISSSIIMVNRANRLSHDSRNTRAIPDVRCPARLNSGVGRHDYREIRPGERFVLLPALLPAG